MNIISTIIISIFSILFITLVLYSILHKKTAHHISPPSQHKIDCPLIPVSQLKKCDPINPESCKDCRDKNYACFTIDKDNPYKYSEKIDVDCQACLKDPSKPGCDSCVDIPNGNWCLPIRITSDRCNEYTSTPILTKVSKTEWRWRCLCKYPEIVNKKNDDADCIEVRACQPDNKIVCPDLRPDCCTDPNKKCNDEEEKRCNIDNLPCKPGEDWLEKKDYDPTLGECLCPPGERPYKYFDENTQTHIMACRGDFCEVSGGKCPDCKYDSDNGTCECGTPKQNADGTWTSFIRCPDDMVKDSPSTQGCGGDEPCDSHSSCYKKCVKDPCNPYGYYDKHLGACKCTGKDHVNIKYDASPVGYTCGSPCEDNIPCGGEGDNKRGDCYLDNGKVKCKNCRVDRGYKQSKDDLCRNICRLPGQPCENRDDKSCCNKCDNYHPYTLEYTCS